MAPRTKKQFEEIREGKRDLIINTALGLFADKGYHATSISQIAKEAGISKGLIYNYFESKEDLLTELFNEYIKLSISIMNPNNDDEITTEEMESFFDLLKKSLIEKNEYWILFSQLSLQKDVFNHLLSKMSSTEIILKHQKIIQKYFAERFDNYETEAFFFISLIKGFSIQYAFAPEMFPDKLVDDFFNKIKKLYIKEKIKI